MFDEPESLGAELTPDLAALQAQLAGLQPAPLTLDRDRLMFEAGRAAAESEQKIAVSGHRPKGGRLAGEPRWLWPTATALMTAACLMLAAMLIWRDDEANLANQPTPPQPATDHLVAEPTIDDFRNVDELASRFTPSRRSPAPTRGYLNVRYVALTDGINAIAHDRPANGRGDTPNEASPSKPATSRGLLEDLLPSDASGNRIRS
jgi:hypothetical protein